MGKVVKAIAGVGLAAAGVITGNPRLILSGIALGASTLAKKPKVGKAARDRLQASINPTAPRTIVFGRTAMATDIRYDAHTGTDQEFYHLIIATSAHKATSHEEIYFGGELAWSNGVVQTKFSGYLTVTSVLEGSSSNVVEIDSRWGSAAGSRLTGCSYVHLRFKRTGNSKKAESPFASNVPTDIVIVGKGIPVYDPSKDSTVPGGSGSHRANNQSTWEFTSGGVDIGRNPALCELTYKLGWRINSIVSVGRGIDPAYLDLPSYITAKNNCNETVALAAGGSEPRYRIDTVYDESESGDAVLLDIRNVMNAYQTDDMGALGLVVRKNDLGTFTSFNDDDILNGVSWQPLPGDVEEFKNIGVGKYSDPRPTALFQLADFPEIRSAAIGGIDRVLSEEFAAVQSASQAQRLIKQKLQRLRYTGIFKANFGPRAYAVRIGSVVSLTCARYAMAGKLFRVMERGVPYNGSVPLTLQEENSAIYAWDAEDSALVTPAAPTVYNYLNDPFLNPIVDFRTQVSGAEKPANNAGTTNPIRTIGTFSTLFGNSLSKSGGSAAFQGGAVMPAHKGTCFVSSSIISPSGGGWRTVLSLDPDETQFGIAGTGQWVASLTATGSGGGSMTLTKSGTQQGATITLPNGTLTQATRWRLVYDGISVNIDLGGTRYLSTPEADGLTFYPKVLDFFNSADSGLNTTDIIAGPWTDNSWNSIGGSLKAQDRATRNDEGGNMIPAPLDPTQWQYFSGAVQSSAHSVNGSNKTAQLLTNNANVRFSDFLDVRGGEEYYFAIAVVSDFPGSETLNISYTWQDRFGVSTAVNLSSQMTITLSEAQVLPSREERSVRFTLPDGAVKLQVYAERPVATGGSFFVNSPFLAKAADNLQLSTNVQLGVSSTVTAVATATDQGGGTGVTISLPGHVRKVPGRKKKRSITYAPATWTNRAYSTTYFLYTLDSGLSGGAVSYDITTDPDDLLLQSALHVATITTPAAGAGPSSGSGGAGSSSPPVGGGSGGGGGGLPQIP